jgi:hypothetical protein
MKITGLPDPFEARVFKEMETIVSTLLRQPTTDPAIASLQGRHLSLRIALDHYQHSRRADGDDE